MNYLFFDTETTGVPRNYKAPASDTNNWPRLIQLGWILTDINGNTLHQGNEIVRPDGFVIPTDAANVHGITTEKAMRVGKPLREVIDIFLNDVKRAKCLVGHNISFDQHVVGAELYRIGLQDIVSDKRSICTMLSTIDYCKIPGYYGYKYPKLQELYNKLFGCSFEDAHDAMADITATKKCFFELKRIGVISSEKYENELSTNVTEEELSTETTKENIENGIEDEYGVVYSRDEKRLLKCKNGKIETYDIKEGTKVICDSAFWDCYSLRLITIPNTVTTIGNDAFGDCYPLQQITIPDSVTSIGKCAFYECDLQQITIPDSVTSMGAGVFFCCYSIKQISISNSVTSIGNAAFGCCQSLQQITIPDSVTSIGVYAFSMCKSLQQIIIPNSVTSIGNDAFHRCDSLKQIIIPEGSAEKFKEMLPEELWDKLYCLKKAVEDEPKKDNYSSTRRIDEKDDLPF